MIGRPFIWPDSSQSLFRSKLRPRNCRRTRQGGQALVFGLFTSILVILALFAMYSMGGQAIEKTKLQNTADAAAYSASVAEARDYNFSAYTNRAMIANQVAVAQFVGLTSWMRNMSAFANYPAVGADNTGRLIYQILLEFMGSPVANFYKTSFLRMFGKVVGIFDEGKPGAKFTTAAITVLDGLILVYEKTQTIYHYSTALSVAQTLGAFTTFGTNLDSLMGTGTLFQSAGTFFDGGSIVAANDPKARLTLAGLPYLAYHYYKWFNFTERKDPNTTGKDGPEADRFAQVTMDSLDAFSRDRSTKPAWGFNFFYAPPLTFIDPTRFIPYQYGPLFLPVIHRGGTELKLTDASGGGGTASGGSGGAGGSGIDCNGNPVSATTGTPPATGTPTPSGATGSISVDYHADLTAYSTTACEGDSGMVTIGNATKPKGVYAFKKNATGVGGTWIDPSSLVGTSSPTPPPRSNNNTGTTTGAAVTGDRSKKSWTAMDASSWAGIDIFWFTIPVVFIPIPLPIPFAPPWLPLSYGSAQSGKKLAAPTVLADDNNFGVKKEDAYGGVADSWTTKISAEMAQAKDAGKSLTLSPNKLGGLTGYMDVKDVTKGVDNLTGPILVVEIEKNIEDMAKRPGADQFATENGAPKNTKITRNGNEKATMRSLSKSQVYFGRPTNDPALTWFARSSDAPAQTEYGSLYNPYWQPRLLANTFLEQYLSMELHRAGF